MSTDTKTLVCFQSSPFTSIANSAAASSRCAPGLLSASENSLFRDVYNECGDDSRKCPIFEFMRRLYLCSHHRRESVRSNGIAGFDLRSVGTPTSITNSIGSQTLHVVKTYYSDANRRVTRCSDLATPGDLGILSVTAYDQLGRVNGTGTLESGNPHPSQCLDTAPSGILTDQRYLSGVGTSYKLVSNPYRSTSDGGLSCCS